MRRIAIYIIFIFLSVSYSLAQLQPVLSEYYTIPYLINPAFAGSTGQTSAAIASRNQWLGIDKAPQYNVLSAETRFQKKSNNAGDPGLFTSKDGRVGLGFSIYNDRNGHFDRTGFQFTYAYHIALHGYNQLSFGLTGSAFQMRVNDKDMTLRDPGDPVMNGITKVIYVPDANVGILLSGINYYAGASVGQLFNAQIKFGNENLSYYQLQRCYYVTGGYFIDLPNTSAMIEPSLMLKSSGQSTQFEIGANYHKRKSFWIGASVRSGTSVIFRMGGFIGDYMICYAYDWGFSPISKYSFGTHEIVIAFHYANVFRQKMRNPY
jgi:type IX secretion system PorP/SprF family membrane protein